MTNLPDFGLALKAAKETQTSSLESQQSSCCQSDVLARMLHLCTEIDLNIVGAVILNTMECIYPLCNDIKEQQKKNPNTKHLSVSAICRLVFMGCALQEEREHALLYGDEHLLKGL